MGGTFSKRNEMESLEELRAISEEVDIIDPQTAEDIEAQAELLTDMDVHNEYSMSNVGGEDNNDEEQY